MNEAEFLAAYQRHEDAKKAVQAWMSAQAQKGELAYHYQAPGWRAYTEALQAWEIARRWEDVPDLLAKLLEGKAK